MPIPACTWQWLTYIDKFSFLHFHAAFGKPGRIVGLGLVPPCGKSWIRFVSILQLRQNDIFTSTCNKKTMIKDYHNYIEVILFTRYYLKYIYHERTASEYITQILICTITNPNINFTGICIVTPAVIRAVAQSRMHGFFSIITGDSVLA